jgi:general secretion pathway protein D
LTIDNQSAFIQTGIHDATPDDAKSLSKGRYVRPDRQDVGLMVGVTPRIGSNGTVVMEIDVDVSELESAEKQDPAGDSSTGEKARSPRIVTTRAQTTISVPEGRTVVLGSVMATPFAPHEELLIVLTPRIIKLEAATETQREPPSR